ncbi:unnamed protein product, partial [Discosporangium mesarthrocarpum]
GPPTATVVEGLVFLPMVGGPGALLGEGYPPRPAGARTGGVEALSVDAAPLPPGGGPPHQGVVEVVAVAGAGAPVPPLAAAATVVGGGEGAGPGARAPTQAQAPTQAKPEAGLAVRVAEVAALPRSGTRRHPGLGQDPGLGRSPALSNVPHGLSTWKLLKLQEGMSHQSP